MPKAEKQPAKVLPSDLEITHYRKRILFNIICGTISNKTGLQPVSRPVELVHYFGGWVEGPSKQTDRTDGGWVHKTFGAKAEQIELTALHAAKHL